VHSKVIRARHALQVKRALLLHSPWSLAALVLLHAAPMAPWPQLPGAGAAANAADVPSPALPPSVLALHEAALDAWKLQEAATGGRSHEGVLQCAAAGWPWPVAATAALQMLQEAWEAQDGLREQAEAAHMDEQVLNLRLRCVCALVAAWVASFWGYTHIRCNTHTNEQAL
jgi:hypothetical protein